MPDRVRVLILCEDRAQEQFFRQICKRLDGRPRVLISPGARGSGEQWVRMRYPDELRRLRAFGAERVGLLAISDGDAMGIQRRKKSLDDACQGVGVPPRTAKERVAICVPTRNIETWIHALLRGEGDVNEVDDYKHLVKPAEARAAGDRWKNEICSLPSCLDAREELKRLDPA